jgi:hypothetical protein
VIRSEWALEVREIHWKPPAFGAIHDGGLELSPVKRQIIDVTGLFSHFRVCLMKPHKDSFMR